MPSTAGLTAAALAVATCPALAAPRPPAPEAGVLGFSADRAVSQRALEARFDASLKPENLREWMRRLSARPHHVGSKQAQIKVQFLADLFRSWGYETVVEEYTVLFPTPKTRILELTAPRRFQASLTEPPLQEDGTSGQTAEQLPVYNAYSIDGDVSGELVYVNYGVPADYEELERLGIDVKGKIVIARYGGSWRGIKPKVAAERGAVGCLIYSDPRDDGYWNGDAYPKGAWRHPRGAQRGSVADMPLYPGDPLTPGVGATKDAPRLALEDAPTLTRIPVLPISHADALPLLEALGGPMAPESWRGALPIPYHLGPGPARVRLKLEFDWAMAPARNVIARLPGGERADLWVLRGNHHDAWVNGADDPVSGLVALLEEARAVAALHATGWTPRRTIVYAAWDAEEPGLLGSTEWVEAHAEELRRHAAVYINTDSNGRGFLSIGGSHTLERFANQVAADVIDPQTKVSVAERARARRILQSSGAERKEARERGDLRLGALGSGSDFTPFLQHLGIASLHVGYGGEDGGGSYHSIYDSFDHYQRFGDPSFEYGIALVQTTGRMVLRLADADVLPLEFTAAADTIERYVDEVVRLTDDMRAQVEERNRLVRDRTLEWAADPKLPFARPHEQPPVPYLGFAPLQNAVARITRSARRFEAARAAAAALPEPTQRAVDAVLAQAERALTRTQGLPGRPWFQHQVYAPGFYTGYGVKTLPAVREAIEQRDWRTAEAQVDVVARTLESFAETVDRAAALIEGGAPAPER